jgi:hypothetical protein
MRHGAKIKVVGALGSAPRNTGIVWGTYGATRQQHEGSRLAADLESRPGPKPSPTRTSASTRWKTSPAIGSKPTAPPPKPGWPKSTCPTTPSSDCSNPAPERPAGRTGHSPEPPRSTSDRRSEVLRGGSGEVRGRIWCRVGGTGGQRRSTIWGAKLGSDGFPRAPLAGEREKTRRRCRAPLVRLTDRPRLRPCRFPQSHRPLNA